MNTKERLMTTTRTTSSILKALLNKSTLIPNKAKTRDTTIRWVNYSLNIEQETQNSDEHLTC